MSAVAAPTGKFTPTPEQSEIIRQPPGAKQLVTAGAGTGKTATLVERIAYLVGEHEVAPGNELLVLSFSRSAVREIRRRAIERGGDGRYIRAQTFDSFATRFLYSLDEDGNWQSDEYRDNSFDARISFAAGFIRAQEEAADALSFFRHIFVDEIQDLVGPRAEFVKVLLERTQCGFTLLGDPAQGIYTFQLEGKAREVGSADLYAWIRKRFAGVLAERTITRNHRAAHAKVAVALWAGPKLTEPNPSWAEIRFKLQGNVMGLPHLRDASQAAGVLANLSGTTALLARTNGQALLVSRTFFEVGLSHCVQRFATDRTLPAWIALLLRDVSVPSIGKTKLGQRAGERCPEVEWEHLWALLKRTERGPIADSLDLALLAARVRVGDVPDELNDASAQKLTVSTIHRSKGMEFENVVLVEPDWSSPDDPAELAEETRVLYVGLTRAKETMMCMPPPDGRGLFCAPEVDERWLRRRGGDRWRTLDVEVRGYDIDRLAPAGSFEGQDSGDVQRYIAEYVCAGDPVRLRRLNQAKTGEARVFYSVEHQGQVVGTTSEQFGGILLRLLRHRLGKWQVRRFPDVIEGLHVEAVDTVAGLESNARTSGLANPFWLRTRVSGLGHLGFKAM